MKNVRRGLESEDLARPAVEAFGNHLELGLRNLRKVHAFGPLLTDQAIGVLVVGPLPGAVRVGEIDLDADPPIQRLVSGCCLAPGIRQGLAEAFEGAPRFVALAQGR